MLDHSRALPTRLLSASLLLLLVAATGLRAEAITETSFEVVLRPETDHSGNVVGITVEEHIAAGSAPRPLTLHAPLSFVGMIPFGSEVSEFSITDDQGTVPLTITDDASAEGGPSRSWTSARPVTGMARVSYRLPMHPFERRGPPYGAKAGGLGMGGNTSTLLVMPDGLSVPQATLRWDLSRMAPGSRGVVTGGSDTLTVQGSPEGLLDRWYLAGPLQAGQESNQAGFNAYTLGTPPFDADATMHWARSIYAALAEGFGYLGEPRYELLIRTLDAPSFTTGTAANAGGGSLIATGSPTYWRGQSEADVKNTIAHEMGHQWVGQFAGGGSLWFAEGLNVYVTSTLPCEAELMSWSDCAAQVSKWAEDYYGSEGRTWSQSAIEAAPFEREDLRLVSYSRGMIYFANLDASIRFASQGERTLLEALRPLFEARRDGQPITIEHWENWLQQERGPEAVTTFRRTVLEGALITPDANAFGPALELVPIRHAEGGRADGYAWRSRDSAGAR